MQHSCYSPAWLNWTCSSRSICRRVFISCIYYCCRIVFFERATVFLIGFNTIFQFLIIILPISFTIDPLSMSWPNKKRARHCKNYVNEFIHNYLCSIARSELFTRWLSSIGGERAFGFNTLACSTLWKLYTHAHMHACNVWQKHSRTAIIIIVRQ